MDGLVELFDNLTSVSEYMGTSFDINLPQIVIFGEPSSGKSSVIESIIGMNILPKGIDVMTRCPIIIQLNHCEEGGEYARFSHKPQQLFYDFGQILPEISLRTKQLIGKTDKFSKSFIHLTIFSPKVLNFSLIDLPGLPKLNEIKGLASHSEIENIMLEHLKIENTTIIAVIEANQDVKQSEIFKIISRVDPLFLHTIGVITKVDLLDSPTFVKNIMENRNVIPGRGWVPVKTRNQKELNSRKEIFSAQQDEINYFKDILPQMSGSCGTSYLKKIINNDMQEIIVACLPGVMRSLQQEMDRSDELVQQMKFYSSDIDKRDIIIKICRNISEDINTSIGLYQRTAELEKTTIGVVINKHMNDGFNSQINNIKEQKAYLRNSIITAVKNSIGLTGFIEIPDKAITSIIRHSNSKFREVVLNVLKQLCECVKECINGTLESIEHYANMHRIFKAHLEEYVDITNFETQKWVDLFFEIDSSHTYFGDLSFLEENWESVTSFTNIEVHKTIFKTDVSILNIKIKPEFAYDYVLILDDSCLSIFTKSNGLERMFCLQNKHIYVKFTNKLTKKRSIRITSKFKDMLTAEYSFLEIQVETELEYNKWRGIFVSKGILCDEIRLIYNNLDHKGLLHEDMVKYEKICMILEKYLTVNRKKIQDLMTKILMKSLIYGFENFCTYKLNSIMLQYDPDELFEITDDNKQEMDVKLEANKRLKSCYHELFKYMDKYAINVKQDLTERRDEQSIEEEEADAEVSMTNRPGSGAEGEEMFQNLKKRPADRIRDFFNNIFSIFQESKVDMEDIQFYDL